MEQIQPIKDSVSMRNLSFNSSNNSLNNSNMISGSNNTVNEIEELDLSFDNFNNYLNDLSINNASIVGSVRTLYSLDDVNNVQQDKAQNFAITDMGTDNEVYWYSYQTYSNSRCVNTNVIAYKGDDVVYSAVLLGGGEGQSFDVVRTNNGYTIYSGSMAVADDSATGRSFGIYKYNIKDSDLGTNEVNFIDVSNSGVNICEAIGKSDDKRGWSEISFDSKNNVVAVHLHQEVYLYRIDNDTPFESFDFSSENAFSHFYLPSLGSRQGGAVSNNKYYYLYGNKGDCRIACVDFSDPNNVKYVFGDDVDSFSPLTALSNTSKLEIADILSLLIFFIS